MSVTVKNIIQEIEKIAPITSACNWDNVGLVCGSLSNTVDKIYFCLELNEFVVEDILNSGSDLVILHHSPMFFPYKNLTDDNLIGILLMKLIHAGISVYCAHTNWDNSSIGVNKQLAEILKIQNPAVLPLYEDGVSYPMGRIGTIEPTTLRNYAMFVSKALNFPALRYVGDPDRIITKVACLGGAGSDVIDTAIEMGADVLVTADITHHQALDAKLKGFCLIDGGHFCTESPSMKGFLEYVRSKYPELEYVLSRINTNPFECL